MKYYLGDVAKILGTTKEGVKYLEKQNLIVKPKINDNGYREYDRNEVFPMRWVRLYHSYGFSNKEIANLMNMESSEEVINEVNAGIEKLEKEIERLRLIKDDLKKLNAWQKESLCQEESKLEIRPTLYRIDLEHLRQNHIPQKVSDSWFDAMPFAKSCTVYEFDRKGSGTISGSMGLGIFEEDLNGWNPQNLPGTEIYHEELCLTFFMEDTVKFTVERMLPIIQKAENEGYAVSDQMISRAVIVYEKDNQTHFVHKVYFPIKKA